MAFRDYSLTPSDNTALGDGTYIGPNMLRNKVRPALQQLAADGKSLANDLASLPPGNPGGNVMSIGTLAQASGLTIPVGTSLVIVSGRDAPGDGGAGMMLVYDAAVDAAYVTANPASSFRDVAGRGFLQVRRDGAVNILDYIPRGAHAAIRAGTYVSNLSAYYATAFAAADAVLFPAGTYVHNSYTIPAGKTLLGEGKATRFKQTTTADRFDSLFFIEASNVTIEDCTVEGNIDMYDHTVPSANAPNGANDSEFMHGIYVRSPDETKPVRNVILGDIYGKNLRGDVVCIYCPTAGTVDGVTVGNVFGENILRNGVSIVGGRNISIGDIDGTAFGYSALDIEPEDYTKPAENITVRSVRGAVVQVAGTPGVWIDGVRIGRIDTSPSHSSEPVPAYRFANGTSQYDPTVGFRARGAYNIHVGHWKARGHTSHAFVYISDTSPIVTKPRLQADFIDFSDIGANETTYKAILRCEPMADVVINGGRYAVASTDQKLIVGNSAASTTSATLRTVRGSGALAHYINRGVFDRITMDGTSTQGALRSVTDSTLISSTITAGYLGFDCTGNTFIESIFTQVSGGPYVFGGSNTGNFGIRSTIAGVAYKLNEWGLAETSGWVFSTGTAARNVAYATYAGQTISAAYTQAEVQAIDNKLKATTERMKALEDAIKAIGEIQ